MSRTTKSPTIGHEYRAAYDSTANARAAIPDADVQTPNVDLIVSAGVAIQALPGIHELEPEMGRVLSKAEIHEVRQLEIYALAMHFAQIAYLATSAPAEPLQDLNERAAQARDVLSSDAAALAKRGLLDGSRLRELNKGNGYRNTAVDCQLLVRLFRDNWIKIDGKTAVTHKELDATETLADELASAVNLREQASVATEEATKDRSRAFTLFEHAYDLARQAASFLRWKQDDVDTYVPSLYAGRGGRGKASAASASTTPTAPATSPEPATHAAAIPTNGAAAPHNDGSLTSAG